MKSYLGSASEKESLEVRINNETFVAMGKRTNLNIFSHCLTVPGVAVPDYERSWKL